MNAIQILRHKNDYGAEKLIFKIRINKGFAYMCNNFWSNTKISDSEQIVIVDSNKFLELWKNDPNRFEHHFCHRQRGSIAKGL